MRVLQIIYHLGPGGAERFAVDISNELAEQGNEVSLCVLRDDKIGNFGFYKKEISNKVNYINLDIPAGLRFNNILILYKLIRKLNPDIVHCHLNLVNYLFPLTLILRNTGFFNTIHSIPNSEVKNPVEYRLRKYFFGNFHMKAITISDEVTSNYIKFYKNQPFAEIYNGRAKPKPTSGFHEVREEIAKYTNNEGTVLLHIGSCLPVKNQEMLINAFNRLISEGFKAVLLIIGAGFDSDEGRRLRSIACDKAIFLGQKHNVSDYLLNSDAFCLSSVREGMPMSLIEALACGCVPVCTPVGGLKNTIINGKTGYISKSVDENDYFYSLKTYLENKDQIRKEDLIRYYHQGFSIEECVRKYIYAYKIQQKSPVGKIAARADYALVGVTGNDQTIKL